MVKKMKIARMKKNVEPESSAGPIRMGLSGPARRRCTGDAAGEVAIAMTCMVQRKER
jgi:hypothetical protein